MSDRERAVKLVYEVPENKLLYLIAYLEGLSVPDGRPDGSPDGSPDESDPFYSTENTQRLQRAAARMDADGGHVHELLGESADD